MNGGDYVPLPRLTKPAYLKPENLAQNDVAEVLDLPYVVSAEDSKFGKQRGYAQIKVLRSGEVYTWGFNNTTWDKLVDAFGDNEANWIGKHIKVSLENTIIRGEKKQVIFGEPVVQQSLKN
jgi:hypothetical protein